MKWQDVGEMRCPIARSLSVIGDRWTVLILRNAFMRMRRFDDFRSSLGLPKHILSQRLKKLVEADVMTREPYQASPVRYEYRLTEKGRELYPVILSLSGWGDKWMDGGQGKVLFYTHTDCGHQFTPVMACSGCGGHVHARNVMVSPGPGLVAPAAGTRG